MPGIEPGAFHMQSERATTALHPLKKIMNPVPRNSNCRLSIHFNFSTSCANFPVAPEQLAGLTS